MRLFFVVILFGLACVFAYIRFAPSDPARWHIAPDPKPAGDYPGRGQFLAVREGVPARTLGQLQDIALATPRTRILAGSVDQGQITFITRSAIWGFPDYTTAAVSNGTLRVFGRLRFGGSDLGVNQARIEGWLADLSL